MGVSQANHPYVKYLPRFFRKIRVSAKRMLALDWR